MRTRVFATAAKQLEAIGKEAPAVVLTDMQMPNMNGLQLVEAVRSDFPWVPIILMTARGSEELAIAALQAGASHYFAKRNLRQELPDVLPQVLAAARTDRRRHELLGCVEHVDCRFVLDNDPALVPLLVAHLQEQMERMSLCNKSGKIRLGVALEEALLNGIYHGNLEVSSDLKADGSDAFGRLAELRRYKEPFASRRLYVDVNLNTAQAVFVIRDEGPGFDFQTARPDRPGKPAQAQRPRPAADPHLHGRGDSQPDRQSTHHDHAPAAIERRQRFVVFTLKVLPSAAQGREAWRAHLGRSSLRQDPVVCGS